MPKAGKNYKKLRVSANVESPSWVLLKGISEAGINRAGDEIDVTDFADESGYKQYLLGLKEFEVTASGSYVPEAGAGQNLLDTAQDNGSHVLLQYLLKNSTDANYTGIQAECIVTNFSHSGSVSEKENVEITLKLAPGGTVTTVTATYAEVH